jgi:iron(III) transport system substrate-binding protein
MRKNFAFKSGRGEKYCAPTTAATRARRIEMNHYPALFIIVAFFIAQSAFAQDAKLIEAAKKESGAIIAYGSMEQAQAEPILEAFQKKTGLKAEYWRASATKAMDRALTELRAGKALFDVMVNNSGAMNVMHKEGVFAKYLSPVAKNFPKDAIDPDLGVSYRHAPIGIIFNKNMIKPADAPKSLDDLLNAKYRGKLVMPDPTQHTTTLQWVSSLYKIMGKEKSEKFIRELGASKPLLVESFAPAAERVMSGETPIAISLVRYVATGAEKGAPVDYVRLGKFLSIGQYLGLSNKAPRLNGGKALIDFFLGEESMKILAKAGEFVTRKGIPHPVPDAGKIQAVEMDDFAANEFKEKSQELQKLFLK